MKIPDNNIISKKSVKNQKEADDKPYFENTHPIFTPEWIDYKQPMKAKEEQEEEEEEKNAPKGKSLLKKIYGGACWKGYEQYGMKIKNGRKVPNCIPTISQNQLREKGGCNGVKTCKVSCPKIADRAVGKYQEVISHLEEHLKEKAGDPKDAFRNVLNVISSLFPLHGIDGDLTFYSTVTKEIVKTFGQIAANEIEIAFRLFAAQSLDLDDDVKFYGKANMHTIGKILNA